VQPNKTTVPINFYFQLQLAFLVLLFSIKSWIIMNNKKLRIIPLQIVGPISILRYFNVGHMISHIGDLELSTSLFPISHVMVKM